MGSVQNVHMSVGTVKQAGVMGGGDAGSDGVMGGGDGSDGVMGEACRSCRNRKSPLGFGGPKREGRAVGWVRNCLWCDGGQLLRWGKVGSSLQTRAGSKTRGF